MHAVRMALWPGITPEQALAEIVQQGFDTDTVAAIAAGILGARFGTSFVDVERLLDRGRLLDYAEALPDRRAPADTEAQLVRSEAE